VTREWSTKRKVLVGAALGILGIAAAVLLPSSLQFLAVVLQTLFGLYICYLAYEHVTREREQ
jgi:hypothetical protein